MSRAAPDAPLAAASASCGNVTTADGSAGAFRIRTSGVSCDAGRRIARAYVFRGNRKPLGFTCTDRRVGDELWRAVCKRGHRWVRFVFGA